MISVAIPVRNGGALLSETLAAVVAQDYPDEVELLVADSGSTDGSVAAAEAAGARVITVQHFSHGGTRNLLMERARGDHVVFLTQDATPGDARWLERLMAAFGLADDVALACGPYRPRPGAPVAVARELEGWFTSLAPDGAPRVDRTRAPQGPSAATFFTDANAVVARAAWERVPFRDVPYAEDQALAIDMLRAGYAKAFMPDAIVIHSHEYSVVRQFQRTFDEWRGLREVHGWVEPANPVRAALTIQTRVRGDARSVRRTGAGWAAVARETARSFRHWTVRAAGAVAGSRADRLPPAVRRLASLEGRASFAPLDRTGRASS